MKVGLTKIEYELHEEGFPVVSLFGRDENGKRICYTDWWFKPYFYGRGLKFSLDYPFTWKEVKERTLLGKDVLKVEYDNPRKTTKYRTQFEEHFEADILFVLRYLIDKGIYSGFEIKGGKVVPVDFSVTPKILFFDLECHQETVNTTGKDEILSISVFDNYLEKGGVFYTGSKVETTFPSRNFQTERGMIVAFLDYIKRTDPDIFTGWNIILYDFPQLLNRAKKLGINTSVISPMRKVFLTTENEPRIFGREIIDLDELYRRYYSNELPSYSLAYALKEELGIEKMEVGKFAKKLRVGEPKYFLEANYQHSWGAYEIDKKCGLIEFQKVFKELAGCQYSDTLWASRIIDMLLLREAKKRGIILPSKPEPSKKVKKGPEVLDVEKGIYEDIDVFDFKALYPILIQMLHISPELETKSDGDVIKVYGKMFKKGEGIVPTIAKRLLSVREELKSKLKDLKGEEYKKAWRKQRAVKFTTEAVIGLYGQRKGRSRLRNDDYFEAVTQTAKRLIRFLVKKIKKYYPEETARIIAGDTDSVFGKGITNKEKFLEEVHNIWLPEFFKQFGVDKNILTLEHEEHFDVLLFKAKKHYAGITSKGEYVIKGLGYVRSNFPRFLRKLLYELYYNLLTRNGETRKQILEKIFELVKDDVDWFKIGRPTKVTKKLDEYKSNSPHIRGVTWSNRNLGTNFRRGSKPMWAFIEKFNGTDVIAYDETTVIPEDLQPDYGRLFDLVLGQVNPILEIGKVKTLEKIELDFNQQGIDKWITTNTTGVGE